MKNILLLPLLIALIISCNQEEDLIKSKYNSNASVITSNHEGCKSGQNGEWKKIIIDGRALMGKCIGGVYGPLDASDSRFFCEGEDIYYKLLFKDKYIYCEDSKGLLHFPTNIIDGMRDNSYLNISQCIDADKGNWRMAIDDGGRLIGTKCGLRSWGTISGHRFYCDGDNIKYVISKDKETIYCEDKEGRLRFPTDLIDGNKNNIYASTIACNQEMRGFWKLAIDKGGRLIGASCDGMYWGNMSGSRFYCDANDIKYVISEDRKSIHCEDKEGRLRFSTNLIDGKSNSDYASTTACNQGRRGFWKLAIDEGDRSIGVQCDGRNWGAGKKFYCEGDGIKYVISKDKQRINCLNGRGKKLAPTNKIDTKDSYLYMNRDEFLRLKY